MTLTDITTTLTRERVSDGACCSLAKYTGGRGRPSQDDLARLAYRIYEARKRRHGHDVDDWLSAEQELIHRYR